MATDADLDLFFPKKIPLVDKMAESAANIAVHNFDWSYVTLLLYNCTFLCDFDMFNHIYGKSVIIYHDQFRPQIISDNIHQYVLFGNAVHNFKYMLENLEKRKFDNTGKFIVLCSSVEHDHCDEIEAVKMFWEYKVINVVFIKVIDYDVAGYTFFHPRDCENVKPAIVAKFGLCIKDIRECENMFTLKFSNLHGCPLIASTFLQPPYIKSIDDKLGADADLMNIIAEKLNARFKFMTPRRGDGWGALDSSGTWIGSLGDVYYDYANLSITCPVITLDRYQNFQISTYYGFTTMLWITPPTQPRPGSLKLLYPYEPMVHIALIITYSFVVLSGLFARSKLWKKVRRELKIYGKQRSIIFSSWTICMGLPIKFKKKSTLSSLVLFWIWYAFIMRTIYQSYLMNSLMSERPSWNVETLEDMVRENYRFGAGAAIKEFYKDNPFVHDNWVSMSIPEILNTMIEISKGAKFGLAVNKEYVNTFHKQNDVRLHILKEKVIVTPTVIFFKKFSPIALPVDRILLKLIEGGIPDKLLRDNAMPPKILKTGDRNEPINSEQFTGCYVILLVGYILSTALFFYEVCCKLK